MSACLRVLCLVFCLLVFVYACVAMVCLHRWMCARESVSMHARVAVCDKHARVLCACMCVRVCVCALADLMRKHCGNTGVGRAGIGVNTTHWRRRVPGAQSSTERRQRGAGARGHGDSRGTAGRGCGRGTGCGRRARGEAHRVRTTGWCR